MLYLVCLKSCRKEKKSISEHRYCSHLIYARMLTGVCQVVRIFSPCPFHVFVFIGTLESGLLSQRIPCETKWTGSTNLNYHIPLYDLLVLNNEILTHILTHHTHTGLYIRTFNCYTVHRQCSIFYVRTVDSYKTSSTGRIIKIVSNCNITNSLLNCSGCWLY